MTFSLAIIIIFLTETLEEKREKRQEQLLIFPSLRLGKHEIGGASCKGGGERSHKEACPCVSPAALLGMAAEGNRFYCSVALPKSISYFRTGGRWVSKDAYRSNAGDRSEVAGPHQRSWGLPTVLSLPSPHSIPQHCQPQESPAPPLTRVGSAYSCFSPKAQRPWWEVITIFIRRK